MRKNYNQVISDLFRSKSKGNIVSLKIKGTEKVLLTSVSEVKGNRIIVLNPVSVYGGALDENIFHVEDIETVKVYSALYHDPVYVRIRALKNSIDEIRRSLRW
jgi:hypothetical protein